MPDVRGIPFDAFQPEHPEQAGALEPCSLCIQSIHDGCDICSFAAVGQVLMQVEDAACGFQSCDARAPADAAGRDESQQYSVCHPLKDTLRSPAAERMRERRHVGAGRGAR